MSNIYLSSTYKDLADYREAVYRALRKLGHNVISMEDYTASNQKPLDKCLADVAKCDIYVGIFAWRYGYIPPGRTESITEIEFREAVKLKKVCLLFLLDENTSWDTSQKDLPPHRINALREELKRDYLVSFFRNKDDLAVQVSTAVSNALPLSPTTEKAVEPDTESNSGTMTSRATPIWIVFAMILVLIGFVIFLLAYDDLSAKASVQGMVGIVLTLIVAVILFSIVNSAMQVRGAALWGGVLGISGAALFYLLLLPMIKPFIFPSHSIYGYVFYESSNPQNLVPVPGVIAVLPSTNQRSAPTDASGRFDIVSVYSDDTNIQFQHGGTTYPAKTTDHADGRYAIIPVRVTEPNPIQRPVATPWEQSKTYKCSLMAEQRYVAAMGFTLNATLARNDQEISRNAKSLHLKVRLDKEFGDLTQPNDRDTESPSFDFVEPGDVETRVLGWEWPIVDVNQRNVKIDLCVNRRKGDKVASPSDLATIYWYGVRGEK
jgi:hypothetical protein